MFWSRITAVVLNRIFRVWRFRAFFRNGKKTRTTHLHQILCEIRGKTFTKLFTCCKQFLRMNILVVQYFTNGLKGTKKTAHQPQTITVQDSFAWWKSSWFSLTWKVLSTTNFFLEMRQLIVFVTFKYRYICVKLWERRD